MIGDNYECDGQMSLFDFIQDDNNIQFNPLEALALCGTGFVDGMDRVYKFFICFIIPSTRYHNITNFIIIKKR